MYCWYIICRFIRVRGSCLLLLHTPYHICTQNNKIIHYRDVSLLCFVLVEAIWQQHLALCVRKSPGWVSSAKSPHHLNARHYFVSPPCMIHAVLLSTLSIINSVRCFPNASRTAADGDDAFQLLQHYYDIAVVCTYSRDPTSRNILVYTVVISMNRARACIILRRMYSQVYEA